ncbi:MAG TPA: sigma-54 dependent transcriptional regulator [Planctomycetota bacterium]|nr:sigma-54 dependent transcriptional regulator [Planctomycetota bacterium]HRR82871.1 sigma-54 dependent transcriptional regulator [Planctomycetota bacterium]
MGSIRILVVDDEPLIRKGFARALQEDGFSVESAGSGDEALRLFGDGAFDLVITDLRMPGTDGLGVLHGVKAVRPDTEVVILTGYGTIQNAVAAIKDGAYNYITKPLNRHELLRIVHEVAEKIELRGRVQQLQSQLESRYGLHNLVGRAPAMQRVYDLIEKVRHSDCTVIITGESGTGKELVARAIHFGGPRAERPFVAVNCGALPESIAERELFGHERGAFTGAVRTQPGYFESADRGTLFLDELPELSLGTQVRLLRVIQQREVLRVGSTQPIPVDVRILAATNRDPEDCVRRGVLREDLYYRLNVVTIHVPPLRERLDDIPLLVEHFLEKCAQRFRQPKKSITLAGLDVLRAHTWPGNVRELENAIERTVTLSPSTLIDAADLPRYAAAPPTPPTGAGLPLGRAKRRLQESFERDSILQALRVTGGNVTRAAESLGIARSALQRLMRRHGIDGRTFREN